MSDKDRKENQLRRQLEYIQFSSEAEKDEILSSANQDSEREKNSIIEKERIKIEEDFQKKVKQTEIKKRIHHSQQLSSSRLQLLKAEDVQIQSLVTVVKKKLEEYVKTPEYSQLLIKLVNESVKKLKDNNLTIRCVQRDLETVKKAVEDIKKQSPKMKISIDEMFFLEDTVIGGVTVASLGDRIICNNTLEHRTKQALAVSLPLIRKTVFPSLQRQSNY